MRAISFRLMRMRIASRAQISSYSHLCCCSQLPSTTLILRRTNLRQFFTRPLPTAQRPRSSRPATSSIGSNSSCRSPPIRAASSSPSSSSVQNSLPDLGSGDRIQYFSGIQPTGILHLGNYLGAIQNWIIIQKQIQQYQIKYKQKHQNSGQPSFLSRAPNKFILSIVDLHALTLPQSPSVLLSNTYSLVSSLLACGISPSSTTLFCQSHLPQHSELQWLLSCTFPFSWLNQMIQFKEKSKQMKLDKVSFGLYAYPVLQAADILLYRATHVPVGEDQQQHLELTREIAKHFNQRYGEKEEKKEDGKDKKKTKETEEIATKQQLLSSVPQAPSKSGTAFLPRNSPTASSCEPVLNGYFPLPVTVTPSLTGRVMSLRDGRSKMSKSADTDASRINLTDTSDLIAGKIRRAVTDSEDGLCYNIEQRAEISNLVGIYSQLTGRTLEDLINDDRWSGAGKKAAFKDALTDELIQLIAPIREEYLRLEQDRAYLDSVLKQGREETESIAEETMKNVREIMGLVRAT